MKRRACILCLAISAVVLVSDRAASAQEAPDAGVDAPNDSLTPPVVRSRAEATYPADALRDRLEATVGLEIVVDDAGHVADARVIAPAGHGFDEAALDTVRKFAFEPARKNGTPIRSTVQLAYEFHPPAAPPPPPPVGPPPAAPT